VRRNFRASLAYRLCLAAEGRFDGMITLRPAWEWDIAAGSLIARQAGLTLTDRMGLGLTFNTASARADGVLALPEIPHSEAMMLLHPAPRERPGNGMRPD
ncbi:MAG: 3'(2'),5'-bisphosphate nucleotidase CysQ, partial [Tabrizicola sp.]|nr:3'(2'),5'-bisphosphate nucleotidase CysQ [Tabrizicola sp.]